MLLKTFFALHRKVPVEQHRRTWFDKDGNARHDPHLDRAGRPVDVRYYRNVWERTLYAIRTHNKPIARHKAD